MTVEKIAPWLVGAAALSGALLVATRATPPARGFDVEGFGHLPVVEGGRIKPADSLARNSLLILRSKQTLPDDGREISANEWLLDVLFRPEVATKQPVFNVDDPDVLGMLGRQQTNSRYLSFADLDAHLGEIQQQGESAKAMDPKRRSRFQSAVVTLYDRVALFHRLANSVQLWGGPTLEDAIADRSQPEAVETQRQLTELALFRPLPPLPGEKPDAWKNIGEALHDSAAGGVDPRLSAVARLGAAYRSGSSWAFNSTLESMLGTLAADHP
jgi:hypothetical protein